MKLRECEQIDPALRPEIAARFNQHSGLAFKESEIEIIIIILCVFKDFHKEMSLFLIKMRGSWFGSFFQS
jgi:hypothetical protein